MKARTIDKRISKLSFAAFEEEFGFKPDDKREQNWFALKGGRLDPRIRRAMERLEELRGESDA